MRSLPGSAWAGWGRVARGGQETGTHDNQEPRILEYGKRMLIRGRTDVSSRRNRRRGVFGAFPRPTWASSETLMVATFSNWAAEPPSGRRLSLNLALARSGLICPNGSLIMLAARAERLVWRYRSFMAMRNVCRFRTSRSISSFAITVQPCSHRLALRFPRHLVS